MSRKGRLALILMAAYHRGSVSLGRTCPHCFRIMDRYDHGKCQYCGGVCGCSHNPTSSGDYCDMHGARGAFRRVNIPRPSTPNAEGEK